MRYTFEKVSSVLSDKFSRLGNEEIKKMAGSISLQIESEKKKSNATKMVVSVSKELTVQEMN